jgi:acetyltransferase-like isoleucine patch superfamily enzyme
VGESTLGLSARVRSLEWRAHWPSSDTEASWMAKPIISPNVRIRVPEHFNIGDDSVIDDYCYFSTRVEVGRGTHIANNCSVAGGAGLLFSIGDLSSLSAGVRIWCRSNDFTNDLIALAAAVDQDSVEGDVRIGDFTGVGANAVVMPNNEIPEGVAVGALSFVPPEFAFEPWTVYAGIPIRRLRARNRARVLRQAEQAFKLL